LHRNEQRPATRHCGGHQAPGYVNHLVAVGESILQTLLSTKAPNNFSKIGVRLLSQLMVVEGKLT
jgi:hypothetical protein